jgi:hypothetical protein
MHHDLQFRNINGNDHAHIPFVLLMVIIVWKHGEKYKFHIFFKNLIILLIQHDMH